MKRVLKDIILFGGGAIMADILSKKKRDEREEGLEHLSEKHLRMFLLMKKWMFANSNGKSISDNLAQKGIKTVVIYGMGHLGDVLMSELRNKQIVVAYGIDRNVSEKYSDINIVSADADLEPADAMIVTPIDGYEKIKEQMMPKFSGLILSLEDIVCEMNGLVYERDTD